MELRTYLIKNRKGRIPKNPTTPETSDALIRNVSCNEHGEMDFTHLKGNFDAPIDSSTPINTNVSAKNSPKLPKLKQGKVVAKAKRRMLRSNENSIESDNDVLKNNENIPRTEDGNVNEVNELVITPITASASPGKKIAPRTYLSPIEKLLAKNGSLSVKPKKQKKVGTGRIGRPPKIKRKQKTINTNGALLGKIKIIQEENLDDANKNGPLQSNHIELTFRRKNKITATIQSKNKKLVIPRKTVPGKNDLNGNHIVNGNAYEHKESSMDRIIDESQKWRATASGSSNLAADVNSSKESSISTLPKLRVGDVCWGPIYSYNYWPCLVSASKSGDLFKTVLNQESINEVDNMVHVYFFVHKGRHSWVKKQNLLPFDGFQNLMETMREKYKNNADQYIPVGMQRELWNAAIEEATNLTGISYLERCKYIQKIQEKAILHAQGKKDNEPTSDIGSLSDSNESIYSQQRATVEKRRRSDTPTSPPYSPIKVVKKHKQDVSETSLESSIQSKTISNPALGPEGSVSDIISVADDILDAKELKKFFKIMKSYVIPGNTNTEMENSLYTAIDNVWKIKKINMAHMIRNGTLSGISHQESDAIERERSIKSLKGLSRKLKNMEVRHTNLFPIRNLAEDGGGSQKQQPKKNTVQSRKFVIQPIEEVIKDIFELDEKYLFAGLVKDPICKYCHKGGEGMKKCESGCQQWFHKECESNSKTTSKPPDKEINAEDIDKNAIEMDEKSLDKLESGEEMAIVGTSRVHITAESIDVCQECVRGEPRKCPVCYCYENNSEIPTVCSLQNCCNAFHMKCLKDWPQAKITRAKDNSIDTFRCPSHVCHTCVSDDPKSKFQPLNTNKMVKCTKCPATYHMKSTCIPAGSYFLTANKIICPRHGKVKADNNVNVNWCLICVGGGNLTCCDACPTSIHPTCLGYEINPEEIFICDECQSGRMPLYGDVVWVKFNLFRWWPAIILPPVLVPQNVMRKQHKPFSFVVRFFGTHDHGWVTRRRVYLFAEGDTLSHQKKKSNLDQRYQKAVQEAQNAYDIIHTKLATKQILRGNKDKPLPEPYTKVKVNRGVHPIKLLINMEKVNVCNCSPLEENPCGPDSNCLNRCLFQQCNKDMCPARERCQNQMFASKSTPRIDVIYMKERGFGLMCLEPISAGTFIIEYVGEVINDEEFQHRLAQKCNNRDTNYYFFSVAKDYIIDAGPRGNFARFMNHSCDPNCETQVWSVSGLNRVGLFAIKDIPANTELTFNYNWDELLGTQKKACLCGAANCVGEIGGKRKEIVVEPKKQKAPVGKKTQVKRKKNNLTKLQKLKMKTTAAEAVVVPAKMDN